MFFIELLGNEVLGGTGVDECKEFFVLGGCLVMYYQTEGIDLWNENILGKESGSVCLFSCFDKSFRYFCEAFFWKGEKEFC